MSHNCLRNTRRGISSLGDLLVDAFTESSHFFETHRPEGVYRCEHVHLWQETSVKAPGFFARYQDAWYRDKRIPPLVRPCKQEWVLARNPAYVIDPERYLPFLARQARYDRVIRETVASVSEDAVHLVSGQCLAFDHLFLCAGQYTRLLSDCFQDVTQLHRTKPVAGTYMEFDLADLDKREFCDPERAFCFDVEDVNVVYRPQARTILLGATSRNDCDSHEPDDGIVALCDQVRTALEGVLTFPDPAKARIRSGVRHKGPRRRPFWGRIAPGISAVYGLYKNAFMTANLAAKELLQEL